MTTVNTGKHTELDRLLADLAAAPRAAPEALMARVLTDAATVQAERQAKQLLPRSQPRGGGTSMWQRLAAAVGGGRVVAGLGTAALAGLALGFVQPAPLTGLTAAVWGQQVDISVDLLPAADDFWSEG